MYFLFLFLSVFAQGEVIFPKNDSYILDKKNVLEEFQSLMPAGGSAGYVVASDKIFLWANSVPSSLVFPEKEDDKDITVPLFVANTLQKEAQLRLFIKEQCDCDIDNRSIGGVIVAHPWQGATMFFKKGWLGHDADDIDGVVPPIVIIYHEFSHASDFIKSQDYFFDMAGITSKQWNNEAEKSAVIQQNDLVHSIAQKKNLFFSLRLSYGRNTLFAVSDIYSIIPLDAN